MRKKSKNLRDWTDINSIWIEAIILAVAITGFFSMVLKWLPKDIRSDGVNFWVYTDWLIDYSAGFTRRGLSGEIISFIGFCCNPRISIGIITWAIFITFASGYFWLCFRSIQWNKPLGLVTVLYFPSFIPFYIFDHSAFGRKEIFGYTILLLHLFFVERYFRNTNGNRNGNLAFQQYLKQLFLISGLLIPLNILMHESAFFLFVPVHILISWVVAKSSTNLNQSNLFPVKSLALLYIPVLFSFSLVFLFGKPSRNMAEEICLNWETIGGLETDSCFSGDDLPGSLGTLSWDYYQAMSLTWYHYQDAIEKLFLVFLFFGSLVYYFGNKVVCSYLRNYKQSGLTDNLPIAEKDLVYVARKLSFKYFIFPAIISLPLYVLGIDYGRWFAVTSINFSMIALSAGLMSLEYNNIIVQSDLTNWPFDTVRLLVDNSRIRAFLISKTGMKLRYFSEWLLLLSVILLVRLPHCCVSDPLGFLAKPLREIVSAVQAW